MEWDYRQWQRAKSECLVVNDWMERRVDADFALSIPE
jgi:hypothetical protein